MATSWKTVRVFISSTFRDMHAERDHLVKITFPRLRQWCEERRLHLVDIDLRWGVTKEEADNGKAITICLQEVDGSRPFFVCVLGGRYGWVPEPGQFPADALDRFPGVRDRMNRSITHLEIIHAVEYPLAPGAAPSSQAFFYLRDPHCTPSPEAPAGWTADERRTYADTFFEQSPDRVRALAELKQSLRDTFEAVSRLTDYSGAFDPDAPNPEDDRLRGRLTRLEAFGERVEADLKRGIAERFPEHAAAAGPADPLAEERALHEAFIEDRTRVHVPRFRVEEALTAYLNGDDARPLVLSGLPGSGKSALLAHWVRRGVPGAFVLSRFVGASPASTYLHRLLGNLSAELVRQFSLPDEIPADPDELRDRWTRILEAAGVHGRVVVVLDAVNQFDPTGDPHRLDWLPRRLPPGVRMVVSVVERDHPDGFDWLAALRRLDLPELPVPVLTDADRRQIIRELPSVFCKTLDEEQIAVLLENPATRNPLFLTVALNELRVFGSFHKLMDEIHGLPRLDDPAIDGDMDRALDALFGRLTDRLDREATPRAPGLVPALFAFLASARQGLSEEELRGVLTRRLPGVSDAERDGAMQVALRQVRPYLMRKGLPSGVILGFYHDSFRLAVRARYLADPFTRHRAHADLAGHFWGQPYWRTDGRPNSRMLLELPTQLLAAGRERPDDARAERDRLYELLADPLCWEAKVADETLGVYALADDVREALALPPGWPADRRTVLDSVERVLATRAGLLAARPRLAAPLAFGPLVIEEGDPDALLTRIARRMAGRWERAHPDLGWFEPLHAAPGTLAALERLRLTGHRGAVTGCSASSDGTRLLTCGTDGALILWDLTTGRPLSAPVTPGGAFTCCELSGDFRYGLAGTADGRLRVVDVETGDDAEVINAHPGPVAACRILSGSRFASLGLWDTAIHLWQSERPGPLRSITIPPASCADFTTSRVVTGTAEGQICVWDLETGEGVRRIQAAPWAIDWCAISANGETVLAGCGRSVTAWRVADGERLAEFDESGGTSTAGAFFAVRDDLLMVLLGSQQGGFRVCSRWAVNQAEVPLRRPAGTDAAAITWCHVDDTHLIAASADGVVRLWPTVRAIEKAVARARSGGEAEYSAAAEEARWQPGPPVEHLADANFAPELYQPYAEAIRATACDVSADGRTALVGFSHGLVRLFDVASGGRRGQLRGHEDAVTAARFAGDRFVLSAGADVTVRLWDLETHREVKCFRNAGFAGWMFATGGRWAASRDGSAVLLWDLASGQAVRRWDTEAFTDLDLSADGSQVLLGAEDGSLTLRGHDDTGPTWGGHAGPVRRCALAPDGGWALSASDDAVLAWNLAGEPRAVRLELAAADLHTVRLAAGEPWAVTLDRGGTVAGWNLTTGACAAAYPFEMPLAHLAATPNLSTAVVCGPDGGPHYLRLHRRAFDIVASLSERRKGDE